MRISPSSHVLFQELDGSVVLLDTESGRYFQLDKVATRIWQLLVTEQKTTEEAAGVLQAEFAAEAGAVQRDLAKFIEQLREAGFMETHP